MEFKGKYYLPNHGVAMGTCPAYDFSYIWMGEITQKHLDSNPVDTLHFMLYHDDAKDYLLKGDRQKQMLLDHLNNLHPNLTWTVECAKEGGYLDLWLMIENGKISKKLLLFMLVQTPAMTRWSNPPL